MRSEKPRYTMDYEMLRLGGARHQISLICTQGFPRLWSTSNVSCVLQRSSGINIVSVPLLISFIFLRLGKTTSNVVFRP